MRGPVRYARRATSVIIFPLIGLRVETPLSGDDEVPLLLEAAVQFNVLVGSSAARMRCCAKEQQASSKIPL